MTAFSVAICTFNGGSRLPAVLERLRSQVNTEQIDWEIIVVDNNSTDNTAKVVQSYQENWNLPYPLKYCFETRQGAAFARQLAIRECQSPLIGFLDDDNLPEADWVAQAYAFGQANPNAGAYGSKIRALYETAPPENFQTLAPFLAIIDRGDAPLQYLRWKKLLPPSAGLVVRKQAWLESVPDQCVLTGRANGSMLTSEDLEVLSYIQQRDWEIWYNPTMCIEHQIPSWRLEKGYLLALMRGIGLSRHVTRMLSVESWQRPLAFLAYFVNDLRKIACHLLKYRRRVTTDLIAACQLELFLSSLISPFYLWKHGRLGGHKRSVFKISISEKPL